MDQPSGIAVDIGLLTGTLVLVTGIAELLGAANMGTALAFGTIAFAIALVWTLARR